MSKSTAEQAAIKSPGRPKVAPGEPTMTIQSKASASQRDEVLALGGSEWLRRQIDQAELPDGKG